MAYRNIFLVDDYQIVNTFHRHLLEQQGSDSCIQAYTEPVKALQSLYAIQEKDLPTLIFLDLMMPHMDGYEFLGHLKNLSRYINLEVVIVTSLPTPGIKDLKKTYPGLVKGIYCKPLNSEIITTILSRPNPLKTDVYKATGKTAV